MKPSKDTMAEGSPEEEAAESPEEASQEGDEQGGDAKIPEAFQKEATALVEQCDNMHCLDFLSNLVSEARSNMAKEQSGSATDKPEMMDTEGMPQS